MPHNHLSNSPRSTQIAKVTSVSRKRKSDGISGETPSAEKAINVNSPPYKKAKTSATRQSQTTSKPETIQKLKDEEKRLKRFRNHPPHSFNQKLHRASTQRMIVVGRTRTDADECPQEDIEVVGSTGNIYCVTISQVPTCTCPDSLKGNECKHKVYALHTVLKAPEHLQYQLAFLKSELKEIFENAPPIPTNVPKDDDTSGTRKPIDGECPICYMDLDELQNELVWCKAACGNNMHKSCFDQWAVSQRGSVVKCVYCRTPWEMDQNDIDVIKKAGEPTADGYVNVAEHFGMSRARDYSGYYQPWVRRTIGSGY